MNQCRLCGLEKDCLTSIFKERSLVDNIQRCLHIQITEYDFLPHKICSACEDEISRIVRYIDGCQKVQLQHHKRIFLEKNKIPDKEIKLEDVPVDFETPPEHCILDHKDVDNIVFARNIPDLPPSDNGKPNTSVVIKANHDQFVLLSAIGKDSLKQLGKRIYERYHDEILKSYHLQITYDEIQNDVIDLQNLLSNMDDPLLKLETPADYSEDENKKLLDLVKIPTIILTPCSETIIPDTNQIESRSDSSLISELSNGNDSKILQCAKCAFKTDRRFRLNQHNFEVHDKRFLCEPCGRRFGKKSKLLHHMEMYHTDLAPIVCSLCNMSFTQRFEYKKHLKTHSNGEGRSWRCDHCGDSFSLQHKLDIHVSRFHRIKSVKCSKCSYVAAHKYQIKQHTREVHEKSIICDHCGKRESKKCRMVAHIQKKHMPKTEFVCDVCTARYFSKAWFEKHKREGCP